MTDFYGCFSAYHVALAGGLPYRQLFFIFSYIFFSVKKVFSAKYFFNIKLFFPYKNIFFSANNIYFVKNTNIFSKKKFFFNLVLQQMNNHTHVLKRNVVKKVCAFFMKLFASKDNCLFLRLSTNQNWPDQ